MIKENIQAFTKAYPKARSKYIRSKPRMPEIDVFLENIVKGISKAAGIMRPYGIKGSVGENNLFMPESPWIGIFDTSITNMSAQKGYYIVYLFVTDMSGFFLSLNQGFTQYRSSYGNKKGREQIRANADIAENLLNGVFDFDTGKIDLKAKNDLAKGYQLGSICSKYYSIGNIPSDEILAQDLNNMIGLYRELKGIIGSEILRVKSYKYLLNNETDEQEYQKEAQNVFEVGIEISLKEGPIPKPDLGNFSRKGLYRRNKNYAKEALRRAQYKCEIDRTHETFIPRNSRNQFVEAHHLIPMALQNDFDFSLDVPENIVTLCPNCHRKIHHSSEANIKVLLKKLLEQRINELKNRGLDITIENLVKCYLKF